MNEIENERYARTKKLESELRATLADFAAEATQNVVFDALYNIIVSEDFGDIATWVDVLQERSDYGPDSKWAADKKGRK